MSEVRIIALLGSGDMVSHFLPLTLPRALPAAPQEFDVRRRVISDLAPAAGGRA